MWAVVIWWAQDQVSWILRMVCLAVRMRRPATLDRNRTHPALRTISTLTTHPAPTTKDSEHRPSRQSRGSPLPHHIITPQAISTTHPDGHQAIIMKN